MNILQNYQYEGAHRADTQPSKFAQTSELAVKAAVAGGLGYVVLNGGIATAEETQPDVNPGSTIIGEQPIPVVQFPGISDFLGQINNGFQDASQQWGQAIDTIIHPAPAAAIPQESSPFLISPDIDHVIVELSPLDRSLPEEVQARLDGPMAQYIIHDENGSFPFETRKTDRHAPLMTHIERTRDLFVEKQLTADASKCDTPETTDDTVQCAIDMYNRNSPDGTTIETVYSPGRYSLEAYVGPFCGGNATSLWYCQDKIYASDEMWQYITKKDPSGLTPGTAAIVLAHERHHQTQDHNGTLAKAETTLEVELEADQAGSGKFAGLAIQSGDMTRADVQNYADNTLKPMALACEETHGGPGQRTNALGDGMESVGIARLEPKPDPDSCE